MYSTELLVAYPLAYRYRLISLRTY